MAITWEVTIKPVKVAEQVVSISATASDSVTESEITVGIREADISTGPLKTEAINIIWSKYQRALASWTARNNVQIACDALELSAKTNLEGRS